MASNALLSQLLSAALLLCLLLANPTVAGAPNNAADDAIMAEPACLPELPPGSGQPNRSAPALMLQMHRWVWIENTTRPEYGPRTVYSPFFYYFVRPGDMLNLSLPLLALQNVIRTNASLIHDGEHLCMAAQTVIRETTENSSISSTVCNSTCFANFTSAGFTANLPTLLLTERRILRRSTEYLAVDSIDPEDRAAYKCMGLFSDKPLRELPQLRSSMTQCSAGDVCLLNFNGTVLDAGCRSTFNFDWCVGNHTLCDYTTGLDCPICCRGDNCNQGVADTIYQLYFKEKAAGEKRASWILIALTAAALSFLRLRSSD